MTLYTVYVIRFPFLLPPLRLVLFLSPSIKSGEGECEETTVCTINTCQYHALWKMDSKSKFPHVHVCVCLLPPLSCLLHCPDVTCRVPSTLLPPVATSPESKMQANHLVCWIVCWVEPHSDLQQNFGNKLSIVATAFSTSIFTGVRMNKKK